MNILPKLVIAGVAACLLAPLPAARGQVAGNDEVALKDGTRQTGKVLAENYDSLELKVKTGSQKFEWSKVVSVTYGSPPQPYTDAMDTLKATPDAAEPKLAALAANEKLAGPLRQNAMLQLAALQQDLGKWADAIASWQALAKAFPQGRYLGSAARGLVDCYLAQNNPAEGGKALDALARDAQAAKAPDAFQAEVGVQRGRLLEAQNKFADARAAYDAAQKQPGVSPDVAATARLRTGECLKREGKASEAEAIFRQLVNTDGPPQLLAGAWNGLGDLLLQQGQKNRDSDTLLEALYAYLRGVVQYPPLAGEPTDEHERAMFGSSESFRYLAQLEKDNDRKALYQQRCNEQLASLKKLYPNSKYPQKQQ